MITYKYTRLSTMCLTDIFGKYLGSPQNTEAMLASVYNGKRKYVMKNTEFLVQIVSNSHNILTKISGL